MADQPPFIHPTAVVDPGVALGPGAKVWHFCHLMRGAQVGPGCILGQNVFVASGVVLGRNCKVQNNVSLYEGVVLEEDVFCGPSMVFTNVVNPRSHVVRRSEFQATLVKRGATLGANCTVVCGHTVGRYAFVAAGAVVTRDVPDHALVMGVPGRRVGWMCACGVRLPGRPGKGGVLACGACGSRFVLEKAGRGARSAGRSGGGLVPAPA